MEDRVPLLVSWNKRWTGGLTKEKEKLSPIVKLSSAAQDPLSRGRIFSPVLPLSCWEFGLRRRRPGADLSSSLGERWRSTLQG